MLFPKYPSHCKTRQKLIVSSENKRIHKGINKDEDVVYHYKIDGEIIPSGTKQLRCDYLLENETKLRIYLIELKGTDICRAVDQIESTIDLFKFPKTYTIFPRIVYKSNTHGIRYPKLLNFKIKYGDKCRIETDRIEECI